MTADMLRVQLSGREWTYLRNTTFLPVALQNIVSTAEVFEGNKYVIRVSRDLAEEFRAAFTERLARVGFNLTYEPTNEGQVLEELIDRFFVQ